MGDGFGNLHQFGGVFARDKVVPAAELADEQQQQAFGNEPEAGILGIHFFFDFFDDVACFQQLLVVQVKAAVEVLFAQLGFEVEEGVKAGQVGHIQTVESYNMAVEQDVAQVQVVGLFVGVFLAGIEHEDVAGDNWVFKPVDDVDSIAFVYDDQLCEFVGVFGVVRVFWNIPHADADKAVVEIVFLGQFAGADVEGRVFHFAQYT